ncbi:mechanosensitive ion channel protein MscS [Flavobacterium crassostreae]|uniref:Mechanosensitive ion channel protein MscS n=1 Tax=Flavobacterium crassostreae TaxID=1763534 RepID=A0A1B9E2H9_9FLAO|nr:mechanosensitive ion channel protein MscS [Flavobacterium crassostreae]
MGKKYSIYNLVKYLIIVIAIIVGLEMFGFNLSVLVAGSAALLVGVGLGLQNLFSDFVSGIILLVDSSVKVNDVLESNGLVCTVKEINLRTTTVLTRDDKYIILPNSDLTKNQLINWTHSDLTSRFDVSVGVDYSSNVNQVMQLLHQAVTEQEGILQDPKPFVRFNEFGDSSLNFAIYFWSEDVFRVENRKSELRIRIFELFQQNNITIPFPQRVVHLNQ